MTMAMETTIDDDDGGGDGGSEGQWHGTEEFFVVADFQLVRRPFITSSYTKYSLCMECLDRERENARARER